MSTSASESSTPPAQSQQQQDSSTPQENSNSETGSNSDCSTFECNICLETAGQPVITMCGHLFCWPCIYKWMQLHLDNPQCPVCKSALSMDKLIPLYGRGKDQTDPRTKIPDIPNRPPGQHAESQPHQYQPQFGFFHGGGTPLAPAQYGNISFSAGIGFFPFLIWFTIYISHAVREQRQCCATWARTTGTTLTSSLHVSNAGAVLLAVLLINLQQKQTTKKSDYKTKAGILQTEAKSPETLWQVIQSRFKEIFLLWIGVLHSFIVNRL